MLGKGVTLEWVTWIREERTIQLCGGNDLGRAKWESKGGQRLREFIMARMMKMKQKELGLLNVGPTVGKRRTSLNSVSLCPAQGSPLPSPSPFLFNLPSLVYLGSIFYRGRELTGV